MPKLYSHYATILYEEVIGMVYAKYICSNRQKFTNTGTFAGAFYVKMALCFALNTINRFTLCKNFSSLF